MSAADLAKLQAATGRAIDCHEKVVDVLRARNDAVLRGARISNELRGCSARVPEADLRLATSAARRLDDALDELKAEIR